jgi:phosphatidylglycerophosphate synthase
MGVLALVLRASSPVPRYDALVNEPRPFLWWLPDTLTLSRVPMGALAWLLAAWPLALFSLMVVAAITDLLDGAIARRLKVDGRGAWLDPLCDKVFIHSVAAALVWQWQPQTLIVVLIALREILQLPLMALLLGLGHGRRYNFKAAYLGKATTLAQFIALCVLMFGGNVVPWAWLAAVLGVLAMGQYAWRALQLLRGAA